MATSSKDKDEALRIIQKLRYSTYYQSEDEVNSDIDKLKELIEKL